MQEEEKKQQTQQKVEDGQQEKSSSESSISNSDTDLHRGKNTDSKNSVKKDEKPSNVIKAFKLGPKCHIHFAIGKTNVEEF